MKKIGLILIAFFLIAPQPSGATGPERMTHVLTEIVQQEIVVSAELTNGFNNQIISDIQDGIPKDFYYYLLLKRKQKNWFDEEVLAKTIRYTVKYDLLKKKYTVVRKEGERTTESTVDNFEMMKRLVSKVDRVNLAPVHILKPRYRYYVSVKSQMKAVTRPFYLDYFLFFIPFLELDTPWADSEAIAMNQR
ncbi:MAG: DUF4390 domain-containing protein [Candidatus Manganitrophaceae bacterium]